jgi:hypothetical protein
MAATHRQRLRALERDRLHVERQALAASSPQVRRRFEHAWAPVERLCEMLAAWPAGLLACWLASPHGYVVLTAGASTYVPAAVPWFDRELQAVSRVSLADLLGDGRAGLMVLAHLVDHLLGSHGTPDGPWLSDGAGITARLRAVGEQIARLARLGYGPTDPHDYFAWAFTSYWLDRRTLNVADPRVERLLQTTLCDEAFWAAGPRNAA